MVGRGPVNYHVEYRTMFQKPMPKPMNDLAILATLIVPQLASSFGLALFFGERRAVRLRGNRSS